MSEPVTKKAKIDKEKETETPAYASDEQVLAKLNAALEGKDLLEDWSKETFFVSIVDGCGTEMVNTEPGEKEKLLPGSVLSELQYKMIAAVYHRVENIVDVYGNTIYPIGALQNWLSDPEDYVEDEETFECREETYGCLHASFSATDDVHSRPIIVRAGI